LKPNHTRAANSQREDDGKLAGCLDRHCYSELLSHASVLQSCPITTPCYELPCSATPAEEGADQSRPTYANAGLVQCFRLPSVVGLRNVLVSRHLWPKRIADTLSITLFRSIGDNSIDIQKISAIKYRQYSIRRY